LKSGNLNLLELSGPVQACNGIALPLLLLVTVQQENFNDTENFVFFKKTTFFYRQLNAQKYFICYEGTVVGLKLPEGDDDDDDDNKQRYV